MRKELVLSLVVYCEVSPLSRPRFSKSSGHVFQPKSNQRDLLWALSEMSIKDTIDFPVEIDIQVFAKKKKSKNNYPKGDVDNYAKAVLDGLVTAKIISDDDLVIRCVVSKGFSEESHTVIDIWRSVL